MPKALRGLAAVLLIAAMGASLPAHGTEGARLEGIVLGLDGRAASEFKMHLIDGAGRAVGRSPVSEDGVYSFRDLSPGDYSLAAEDASGFVAPVAAPPVRLGAGSLGRRDVRIVEADLAARNAALESNPSLGLWWVGMSPAARAGTIVGIVLFVALTVAAIDNGDDDEPEEPASP